MQQIRCEWNPQVISTFERSKSDSRSCQQWNGPKIDVIRSDLNYSGIVWGISFHKSSQRFQFTSLCVAKPNVNGSGGQSETLQSKGHFSVKRQFFSFHGLSNRAFFAEDPPAPLPRRQHPKCQSEE